MKKIIDVVNKYNNVLYEISNENHPPSTEWQYKMIEFIKDYEKNLPKQHPVGMTFQYKGGSNQALFDSPAEWISPNPDGGYKDNPPAATGKKVIITDTDHLWGIGGSKSWVWKSFLRGMNTLFMDPYECKVLTKLCDPAWLDTLRTNLGYTLRFAERMDLISMIPSDDLASSSYCLANPGKEYLVYVDNSSEVTLDLSAASGTFVTEWFNTDNGETIKDGKLKGGKKIDLKSPSEIKNMVLYVKRK